MAAVMTVLGAVDSVELGITLPHEHILINLLRERPDGLLHDESLMADELLRFRGQGGRTLVDCTTSELGRDPEALARLARATGLNIISGCGHYRDPYLDDAWIDSHSVDELADAIVRETRDGIDGSGVRPGIIGEIGCNQWYVSAAEERSFRAAARAQQRTGLTITTHAAHWPVGLLQLDILESEGVDPHRVIVGHCDTVPLPEYHEQLARRGAFVQFDTIRKGTEYDLSSRVRFIQEMVRHGFLEHILLSHDVCLRSHLTISSGGGYDFILSEFLPRLRRAGLSESDLDQMVHINPRVALAP